MASTEAAAALLTAVSIGIATMSILVNNINFMEKKDAQTLSGDFADYATNKVFLVIGFFTSMIFFAFGSSIVYLYVAEFQNPFPTISENYIFAFASATTLIGIYSGIIGLILAVFYQNKLLNMKSKEKKIQNIMDE